MGCAGRPLEAAQVSSAHHLRGDVLSESRRIGGSSGQTVNKSCDACNAKKRKCDGGDPCSRCVKRGDGHLCKYSRRRPYTSSNRRSRAWRLSTGQKSNKITTARAKPCSGNSTGAHRIGRAQQEMRCVEESRQLSPDAPSIPAPATGVRLSTTNYDVHAKLARARREVFELIVSTSRSPLRARNELKSAVKDSKPKTTVECLETELKASVEKCILPMVHGLDFECQTGASSAFPVVDQSPIRTGVGMDIAKGAVPIFDDIVMDFVSHNHSQYSEYVASIIPPSHARTLSMWELEDPISAEDWLEIAAG